MPKILVLAGSARSDSLNKKLALVATSKINQLGADATFVDLRDFSIPLYDGDTEEEQGLPKDVEKLRQIMQEHDGLLLACPEYNGSITPLLKNVIDWTSRPSGETPSMVAYSGKVAALVSASPGALGGMRGLVHVRAILSGIGVHVIPKDAAIGSAHSVLDAENKLSDENQDKRLNAVVESLVETTRKLQG